MQGDGQVDWDERALLATHPVEEPLVAAGIRCHGGFDASGAYVSPRTAGRIPAIEAWQARHRAELGTSMLDVPLATWPAPFPNVAQAACLLRNGVREPVVTQLTRIGTVEGFGAVIRNSTLGPDPQRHFDESIAGTAIAHLERGLFEAHARDEAGWGDEGGHREMWFAARDVAFEQPRADDQTEVMVGRLGVPASTAGTGSPIVRVAPDLDPQLEQTIQRMIAILLIEISAFHVFAWAEELLSDDDLVAGDGEAARLVSYIRQDEQPHVEYLRTVLTEMRDRTFVGESGRRHDGRDVIGRMWDRALADSLGPRREQSVETARTEIRLALEGHRRRDAILDEIDALGAAA